MDNILIYLIIAWLPVGYLTNLAWIKYSKDKLRGVTEIIPFFVYLGFGTLVVLLMEVLLDIILEDN